MFGNFIVTTATYDKANDKMYATVNASVVQFSKDDFVFVIMEGRSYVTKVEELEIIGAIATIAFRSNDIHNSGLKRRVVLLKTLSKSIPLKKSFATIDLPSVLATPAALSELKDQIASGTLNFAQAAELIGLTSSSQATVKINAGNPATMVETYYADKVKVNFSTKKIGFLSERTIKGQVITSGSQPAQPVYLFDYLQAMRLRLREQDAAGIGFGFVILYTATVVDEKLNVVVNKKPIKDVRVLRRNGKREQTIIFEDEFRLGLFGILSGTCTVIIEKLTVKNADYFAWSGSSRMPTPHFLPLFNQEERLLPLFNQEERLFEVNYVKKYKYGLAYLELDHPRLEAQFDIIFNNKFVSLTVDHTTIYGNLIINEENNFIFTKPKTIGRLAWNKDMTTVLQSHGHGIFAEVPLGSPANDEMLQIKVNLDKFESALNVYKALQTVWALQEPQDRIIFLGQLFPILETFNVTDVVVAGARAEVRVITALATLATGTVKWFNKANYFEITVKDNSIGNFTMCNSNGVDEYFQEVDAIVFLNAAVSEIKENYENNLKNIINPSMSISDVDDIVKSDPFYMLFATGGETCKIKVTNAEILQTIDGTIYKFFYENDNVPIVPLIFDIGAILIGYFLFTR